ncbi:hypothetical protein [Tautonia plasticadhaerens]|uniref:Uncharacterized protein n=1 Tax=Tautonia plasticadhaerens TaxID=2527974 RepID=A0A518HDW4_9BACT|nr:hypothetical protein [Tautonia plasticadhaerens]QDV39045.1 hypothetical protein ElP_70070 [Tautonia plasticadhaerens]
MIGPSGRRFRPNRSLTWTPAAAVELHDDSHFGVGSEAFFGAIEGRGFEISHFGETTYCRRPG